MSKDYKDRLKDSLNNIEKLIKDTDNKGVLMHLRSARDTMISSIRACNDVD